MIQTFSKAKRVAFGLVMFAIGAAAQTQTPGKVPVFGQNSSITDSPISISGSNVGIGTTSPYSPLTITGRDIPFGETLTLNPAPNGYTTVGFNLVGGSAGNGWYLGKTQTLLAEVNFCIL